MRAMVLVMLEAVARAVLPVVQLTGGLQMPAIAIGTGVRSGAKKEGSAMLIYALESGFRHIDAAESYGSAGVVGKALHAVLGEGRVRRGDLFVTVKLGNDMHNPEDVPRALNRSLSALRLSYADLFLMHWPVSGTTALPVEDDGYTRPTVATTWSTMEELVRSGRVRALGVSNFGPRRLRALVATATIPPVVNQVELHPIWRDDRLLAVAKELGVHLSAYSPLGGGSDKLLESPVVDRIAQELGRTPAQVLLRWGLERGTSVVTASRTRKHLDDILAVADFALSPGHMSALSTMEPQKRVMSMRFAYSSQGVRVSKMLLPNGTLRPNVGHHGLMPYWQVLA